MIFEAGGHYAAVLRPNPLGPMCLLCYDVTSLCCCDVIILCVVVMSSVSVCCDVIILCVL